MVRSFKTGLGMIKYSLAAKMNIALMIVFLILGIFYEIMTVVSHVTASRSGFVNYNGIWMLALAPLYAIQLMYGISLSGVVQSSCVKKMLLVDTATVFKAVCEVICFAILVLTRYLSCRLSGDASANILFGLIFFGIFSMLISLYTVIIYRYVTIGYVVMLPLIIACMLLGFFSERKGFSFSLDTIMARMPFGDSFPGCLAIGALLVIIDIVAFYFMSRVFYKIPLSEKAFRQMLARVK